MGNLSFAGGTSRAKTIFSQRPFHDEELGRCANCRNYRSHGPHERRKKTVGARIVTVVQISCVAKKCMTPICLVSCHLFAEML